MLQLAKSYSTFGLVCIPCIGKKPLVNWRNVKKTCLEHPKWKQATALAILAGPSNICVIDVDVPEGQSKNDFFNRLCNSPDFKCPPMVETPSGGFHLYYKTADQIPPLRTNWRGLDIDTRVLSSYVIAPGSVYKTTKAAKEKFNGEVYEMCNGSFDQMFPIPQFWVKFCDEVGFNFCTDTFTFTPKTKPATLAKVDKPRRTTTVPLPEKTGRFAPQLILTEIEILRIMKTMVRFDDGSRDFWVNGVWAWIKVAKESGYDEFRLAVAWSKMLPGYDEHTDAKLRHMISEEYDHDRAQPISALAHSVITDEIVLEDITHLIRKRMYYHTNDVALARKAHRQGYLDWEMLKDFFSTAFAVVDSGGHEYYMLREKTGWKLFLGTSPFMKDLYNPNFTLRCQKRREVYEAEVSTIKTIQDTEKRQKKMDELKTYKDIQTNMKTQGKNVFPLTVPRYSGYTHQHYYGIQNAPKLPDSVLNTFTGYKYRAMLPSELKAAIKRRKNDWNMLIRHWCQCLCGGDKPSWQFVQSWLTRSLTRGYEKPPEMCVFVSKQGYGKSMLWEGLMMGMLGHDQCTKENSLARFLDRFNGHREGKILHIMNEVSCTRSSHGKKINHNQVKGLSDVNFLLEYKNKERRAAEDFGIYVFLSNHEHSIVCENDDRRFLIMEAKWLPEWGKLGNKRKDYKAYFTKLKTLCVDEEIQQMFFSHLIHREVDMTTLPNTHIKQRLKTNRYANSPLKFLSEVVCSHIDDREAYSWYWTETDVITVKGRWPPRSMNSWFSFARVRKSYDDWIRAKGIKCAPTFDYYFNRVCLMKSKRKTDRSLDRERFGTTRHERNCMVVSMESVTLMGRKVFNDDGWTPYNF